MSSSAQRKRRTTGSPLLSRSRTKTSRTANASRMANVSMNSNGSPPTETIDVMDNAEDSVEEVVDLTCEGIEAAVVDLTTNNDSVLLVDEGKNFEVQRQNISVCSMKDQANTYLGVHPSAPRNGRVTAGESYVVSSDEDEETPPVLHASTVSSSHSSRLTPGTISCPVCLDVYSEIIESGRLVVSTKCGHVFCSQCLRDALASSHNCPTCRKRLTHRQYHPLYI